ncbi:MAG: tRNA (adenosine(37)-N6)-threonylcarbamoyltransferase complex dimerization subunit type 1 TsaB [Bacteroidota bacterium]
MALILSLESSVSGCSVAVHRSGELLGMEADPTERSAARSLALLTEQLLKRINIRPDELEAVAVAAGPGSYTGLRIAAGTAKGLCFALGLPLIAVNSLEVLAARVKHMEGASYLAPMFDARRMEVYTMVLDQERQAVMPVKALVLDKESFADFLEKGTVLFFGNGAQKVRGLLTHSGVRVLDGLEPDAAAMGALAWNRFRSGSFESVADFEPRYLKEFMVGGKPVQG